MYGPVNVPGDISAEASGSVPATRKINGKALSADISLSAADVSALASGGTAVAAKTLTVTELAANTDLNTIQTTGWYRCPANATVATFKNCPTTNAFCLEVLNHAGTMQRLTEYPAGTPVIWVRNMYNSTWGSWAKVYTSLSKPTPADIGAAAASHGTHVTYGATNPVMDGTASPGSAAALSRSDQISRAV